MERKIIGLQLIYKHVGVLISMVFPVVRSEQSVLKGPEIGELHHLNVNVNTAFFLFSEFDLSFFLYSSVVLVQIKNGFSRKLK